MAFKPLSCVFGKFVIYQRYIMTIMMQLGICNAFNLRVALNIAMAEMKVPFNYTNISHACPMYEEEYVEGIKGGRYNWSSTQESWMLGTFYFGYLISHVPGGWLADKIGSRHVFGTAIIVSALLTLLLPLCISVNFELAVLMRTLIGLVQGPIYPSIATFIQCWAPEKQKSFLVGLAYTGSNLGPITGNIITGYLIGWTNSWETPFYVWPICGIIWYIFYLFMVFSRPDTHPFITKKELEYLKAEIPERLKLKVPWKAILTSGPVYAVIAAQFGHDYLFYTILTDLPKYMKDILKMNIKRNAVFSSVPFMSIWISSIVSAYFADFIINKKLMSEVMVRRVWTSFAAMSSAVLIVLVVYIGCNRLMVTILFALVMFFHGPFYSGAKVSVNDMTRYYSGCVMALANGTGAFAGILAPVVIGFITKNHSLEEWQIVMWIMFGVQLVTTLIYCFLVSPDRQPWDYPIAENQERE